MEEAARNQLLPLRGSTIHAPLPSLTGQRTDFTFSPGAVGIPEKEAPKIFNRSWSVSAVLEVPQSGAHGVLVAMGGAPAGWSLYLDAEGRPAFAYRAFEVGTIALTGRQALDAGRHVLRVDFDYDGGGYAKGGTARLMLNGQPQGEGRVAATPPAFFSIDETFDVGIDRGSPVGRYPAECVLGYPFSGGRIERVDVHLR